MCGDADFEGMVIDINYDGLRIASINYEKGVHDLQIELFPAHMKRSSLSFPLSDFHEALEKGKQLAIRCAKEDELRKK